MPRGRKRKSGPRQPNGQRRRPGKERIIRERTEDMTRTAREARTRVHGVPPTNAGLADAGDVLGRFVLSGDINPQQRDAGRLYEEVVAAYDTFLLARRVRSGGELDRVGGHDNSDGTDPDYVAGYERAKGRYVRARRVLLLAPDANAQLVVDGVVLDDKAMWHQIGALRTGLNALAHEFREELLRAA